MSVGLERLARRIGYRFQDRQWLQTALTHRSAGGQHNERLEFLGDAVLGFVVAAALYERHPRLDEGNLSRLRASLVKGETLAELARALQLGDHLVLGSGEMKSGGHRRDSILSDAFEALIGAIYLDGGIEPATRFIHDSLGSRLDEAHSMARLKDPKTRLQEFLQSRGLALPEYRVLAIEGEAHDQTFQVECRVSDLPPFMASGGSRRKAEQSAARTALEHLMPEAKR